MDGLEPVVHAGRDGTRVDRDALLAALVRHTRVGQSPIHVHWTAAPPALNDAIAEQAAATARLLVSAPIELRVRGVRVGSLAPARLARLIRFRPSSSAYVVALDEKPLAARLRPLVGRWARDPVDATFRVDGERAHVVPAKDGIGLDAAASVAAVLAAGHGTASRTATLRLAHVRPELTTAAARRLGIRRKLVSYTTVTAAASPARDRDARLLVERVAGTILRPKRVFSFNRVVGEPTAARGFVDGRPDGSAIAGAVGQAATALFNGAFRLGLPILERHPEPSYDADYPAGRDAAVVWGASDLRFRNDLKHAILITASYEDRRLTVACYGATQPRRVRSVAGLPTNWTRPPLTRGPGRGGGQDGFDITVERTVAEHGKTLRRDSFSSHYDPAGTTRVRAGAAPSPLRAVLQPR